MAAEFDVVDLWVGYFASKRALNAYLKETYNEDNEDAPISQFARDIGQSFYDHDLIEVGFRTSVKTFEKLCVGHTFAENFVSRAQPAFQKSKISQFNTLVMAFGKEIDHPKSIRGDGYELHYLGRFDTRPDSKSDRSGPSLFLEIRGGCSATVSGQQQTLVKITQPGAIVGHGGSHEELTYIDITPNREYDPDANIAEMQLHIFLDQNGQWVLEDVAGGDNTAYVGRALNHEKVIPGHDQRFGVGRVTLAWLLRPPRGKC